MKSVMSEPRSEGDVRAAGYVVARVVEDRTVIVDMDKGTCWDLNTVGAAIWRMIGDAMPREQLPEAVAQAFQIPLATAARDVNAFIEDMLSHGLLVECPTPKG